MAFSQPSQKFYTPYTDIYESRMLRFYGFTLLEFGVFPLIAKICYLFFLNEMKLKILFCVIQSLNSHWNISMLFPYNRGCVLLNLSAYCARFVFIIPVGFLTYRYEHHTHYKFSEINLIHLALMGQLLIFFLLDVWPPSGDHTLRSLEGYFAKYFQSNIFIFLSVWMWPPHTARARQASSDLQLTRSTRHHTTPHLRFTCRVNF